MTDDPAVENLLGNVIQANDSIDGVVKKFKEILGNKNPAQLQKLREDYGIVVMREISDADQLGQDDEYIFIPKSLSSKSIQENSEKSQGLIAPKPEGVTRNVAFDYPEKDDSVVLDSDEELNQGPGSKVQSVHESLSKKS